MSDSLNNKELVAVGHQFAKAMSADTPIIDMAKIVSRLAERLDCTTAALREMTKQRDASEQAERVWETAMMQACGEDGPKSVADKFAALEAKCAALAAENAALKSAIQTHSESIHFFDLCGKDDPCSTDDVCMALSETPDTDAYLTEVRAQVWIEAKALAKSAIASDSVDHIDFLFDGKAAQLRQGGAE
ncbi:hypothetical protein ES815_22160 [Leclercia adecarboxylata]|uniref:Ead/Ea22-like family protein n=1 Tax=Leclercia adecarboxylata TaxID=83655 RepID=A0AAP9DDH1_9ENTR|nr:hypothetical protein [Leclercia adecarboxylata]QDK20869.1 hypothetical protein ES815_22160 [Leclercia adecarboxylata]